MTAIIVKVDRSSLLQRKPQRHLLEVLVCNLIIISGVLSIVLSSIAVCDGRWLQAPGGHVFGLWCFCTTQSAKDTDGHRNQSVSTGLPTEAVVASHCTTQLGQSGVRGVELGIICCRVLVSMAVVAAIFGLEFQVISRVSDGQDSARRLVLGSFLMMVAASASASGVVVFVTLFRDFVSLLGLTLIFWCQITAVFLFLLSGLAARHMHHMNTEAPVSSSLHKC